MYSVDVMSTVDRRMLYVLSGFTSVMKTLRTNTLTQPMTTQPVYTIQNWS